MIEIKYLVNALEVDHTAIDIAQKTRPQTVLHSALSHAYSPDGFLMVPDGFLMVPDGFLMVPDGFLMVSVGSLPQNSVIQLFSSSVHPPLTGPRPLDPRIQFFSSSVHP